MSDKCEWKDGKFEPNENMLEMLKLIGDNQNVDLDVRYHTSQVYSYIKDLLEKPEEKPDKIYLFINGEKFVIDFDDTAEKVERNIAEIITRETNMIAKVEIVEPEEKPLIVKDGGTWAAHWKGVDYLFTSNRKEQPLYLGNQERWKPFSEIEKEGLTDEIALLRPMVTHISDSLIPVKLYGVDDNIAVLIPPLRMFIKNIRLATPHELQEQS